MVNVTTSGPFLDYNSNDHTALVVIVTVFFCLLMITVMVAKVIIRRHIRVALQDFDAILFLAALLMLAQTICIVCASDPGIGKHLTDVMSHLENIQKVSPRIKGAIGGCPAALYSLFVLHQFQYAASLLAVATITCTKISMSLLIKRVNNYGRVRLANRIILGITLASFVSVIFATAFQCPLPRPWSAVSRSVCPDVVSIYLYGGIMSIITDVQLCVLAAAMVWDMKMDLKNRYIVIVLFSSRVL